MTTKRVLCLVLCAVLIPVCASAGQYQRQKSADQARVKKQSAEDIARKQEILTKMRAYMGDINSRLAKKAKQNWIFRLILMMQPVCPKNKSPIVRKKFPQKFLQIYLPPARFILKLTSAVKRSAA